jgi:hypothetical protein
MANGDSARVVALAMKTATVTAAAVRKDGKFIGGLERRL